MAVIFPECIELLSSTAEALDDLVCHVGRVNVDLPSMSWLWFVAQELPDTERYFPHGKWATLQHIEAQLHDCAAQAARSLATTPSTEKE